MLRSVVRNLLVVFFLLVPTIVFWPWFGMEPKWVTTVLYLGFSLIWFLLVPKYWLLIILFILGDVRARKQLETWRKHRD